MDENAKAQEGAEAYASAMGCKVTYTIENADGTSTTATAEEHDARARARADQLRRDVTHAKEVLGQ